MSTNFQEIYHQYKLSVDTNHKKASEDLSLEMQLVRKKAQDKIDMIAASEVMRGAFLASLLDEGHEKLQEIFDPAFLDVQEARESFACAVRALDILHREVVHTPYSGMGSKEAQRQNYEGEPKPRKVLTHLGWSNDVMYDRRLPPMFPDDDALYIGETHVHPTTEGKAIIDQYRAFATMSSFCDAVGHVKKVRDVDDVSIG